MLKRIGYETASRHYPGEVVYTVLLDTVIFSGITKPGSTINFAEDIIQNIVSRYPERVSQYYGTDGLTSKHISDTTVT